MKLSCMHGHAHTVGCLMQAMRALQVTTRDESGQMTAHGVKQLPSGMLAPDGPPTTLGPSGRDWVAFLQGNVTRDATYFVNGTPVGARDIFQVPARPAVLLQLLYRTRVSAPYPCNVGHAGCAWGCRCLFALRACFLN